MMAKDVLRVAIQALNAQEVSYMVVGSLATNFYCTPRSTQDADIVVESSLVAVAQGIAASDDELKLDPQLGFESVTGTKKAVLLHDRNEFQIELFELSSEEHDQSRFGRRVHQQLNGDDIWIATAEDTVVTKLRWSEHAGREKDTADVRNVIAVQKDLLDWSYIERWAREHGTLDRLNELRRQVDAAFD